MKTKLLKISLTLGLLLFLIACSTRRDSWLSRNSHALSTKYNILYNGGLALEQGKLDLQTTYADDYWDILTIERMQPAVEGLDAKPISNPNFDRAEEKATKAIQKHSMNIGGTERNSQMDEAHLMLGQARYYSRRFVPALEAFNYVLYKHPGSSKINEVKIWREKTNMRLENDAIAARNLTKLLGEIKLKDQIFADANAALAQAYINLEQQDSAISRLSTARRFTKIKDERARYGFIIGQLHQKASAHDSARVYFQEVIDMNRQSPRMYVIQAHAQLASYFEHGKQDTTAFTEKFNKLLADRENRPYLDVLHHHMGLFYDKQQLSQKALYHYNKSLDNGYEDDQYLWASNYRNIADIHFDEARYTTAGVYYDSTMIHLKPRTREFRQIYKKRENLNDVIKYENVARTNDSILNILKLSESDRVTFFENHIAKLREAEARNRERLEKEAAAKSSLASASPSALPASAKITRTGQPAEFYFYNPTLVATGKLAFARTWGERTYQQNWRTATTRALNPDLADTDQTAETNAPLEEIVDPIFTTDYYLSQLPTRKGAIDTLKTDRNFAYYQLGVIYKEKFREYDRASEKLEALLVNQPEERLILPSQYNLYKIYEVSDPAKAQGMKSDIIRYYPDSRYAQILRDAGLSGQAAETPEAAYEAVYRIFEAGDFVKTISEAERLTEQFQGEEIVPKFELLKARAIGRLRGLDAYVEALNYTALTYPNSPEGKDAEAILSTQIPVLQQMQLNDAAPTSWKLLYRAPNPSDKKIVDLQEKLKKFISERTADALSQSLDQYTETMHFVVVHGIRSEEGAKGIASVLKEFKEYKVTEPALVISNTNYAVVQMKKNLDEYLQDPQKPAEARVAQTPRNTAAAPQKQPLQPRPARTRPGKVSAPTALPMPGASGIGMPPQGSDDPARATQPGRNQPSTGARGNQAIMPPGSDSKR